MLWLSEIRLVLVRTIELSTVQTYLHDLLLAIEVNEI